MDRIRLLRDLNSSCSYKSTSRKKKRCEVILGNQRWEKKTHTHKESFQGNGVISCPLRLTDGLKGRSSELYSDGARYIVPFCY